MPLTAGIPTFSRNLQRICTSRTFAQCSMGERDSKRRRLIWRSSCSAFPMRPLEYNQSETLQWLSVHGAVSDATLIQELAMPGSDVRHGVNLICRPSTDVSDLILSTQKCLRELEPDQ